MTSQQPTADQITAFCDNLKASLLSARERGFALTLSEQETNPPGLCAEWKAKVKLADEVSRPVGPIRLIARPAAIPDSQLAKEMLYVLDEATSISPEDFKAVDEMFQKKVVAALGIPPELVGAAKGQYASMVYRNISPYLVDSQPSTVDSDQPAIVEVKS